MALAHIHAMKNETSFQRRVRAALENKTRVELAAEVGVDRSVVSKWLTGITFPGVSHLAAVARAFGVSLESLTNIIEESRGKRCR